MSQNPYPPLSYNQMFGLIIGGTYLAVGLAGFVATGGIAFSGKVGGAELQFFSVNPLHNLAHLAIGGALLLSALAGPAMARAVTAIVGSAYLALGVLGLFILDSSANILALNTADNLLHLGTGTVALYVAAVIGRHDLVGARA